MTRRVLAWGSFAALAAWAVYGSVHERLFAQELRSPEGLERWLWFTGIFWTAAGAAFAANRISARRPGGGSWRTRYWFTLGVLGCAAAWALWWCWEFFDPLAPVAAVFFLGSCFCLGRWIAPRADGLIALLAGLAAWIFVISLAVHLPVNKPWVYAGAFAIPYLKNGRSLARSIRVPEISPVLLYLLAMYFLIALKPEASSDGLAMHLAIPAMIAHEGRFAFDFQHYAWALMPMGGDFAFTAVYLLAGEMAARLLNFALFAAIVALVYRSARQWLAPERASIAAALFASTPVAQLVTGSLFVENMWAAFIVGAAGAVWQGEMMCAGLLFGSALAVKVGTVAFLVPAAVLAAFHKNRRAFLPACALLAVFAAPPYLTAWMKTGNPVFPFANRIFKSPYFNRATPLQDARYSKPLKLSALYDAEFRSSRHIEGHDGALGFQYFLLTVPLLLLMSRRGPGALVWIGAAGAVLTFASVANLRYLYPALALLSIGFAWMMAELPGMLAVTAAILALNVWFLPAAGWYHPQFALFTESQLSDYVKRSAPTRKLVQAANERFPGEPMAFIGGDPIAGLHAPAYSDTWHTYEFWRKIIEADTPQVIREDFRARGIRHVITAIPARTDYLSVQHFVEQWTAPTGISSGEWEIRTVLEKPVDRPRDIAPVPPGSYDDLDQRIEYTGAWLHDRQFSRASGGSITYSNRAGDTARLFFDGTSIEYVYTTAFNRGIVEVSIDRAVRARINLYSIDTRWQQRTVFGGLGPGGHTIEFRVSGAGFVDVDRLVVSR